MNHIINGIGIVHIQKTEAVQLYNGLRTLQI